MARRRIAKRNLERLEVLRRAQASSPDDGESAVARDGKRSKAGASVAEEGASAADGDVASASESSSRVDDAGSPAGGPYVVAVLGSGKFGTAMCVIMARNGHTVRLLTRRSDVADAINKKRRHTLCYPEIEMPSAVSATTDPAQALTGVDFVVHAVPVQASQAFLRGIAKHIPRDAPIVSLSKSALSCLQQCHMRFTHNAVQHTTRLHAFRSNHKLVLTCVRHTHTHELKRTPTLMSPLAFALTCTRTRNATLGICLDTLHTMAEVFADVLGPDHPSCFLSGPSFASELIRSQPTGMVLAASNLDWARAAAPLFHSPTLRVYLSDDVVGVEMTGALKNV